MAKPRPPLAIAFRQRYIIQDGCWPWLGEKDKNGYGQYVVEKIRRPDGGYKKKRIKAHRLAWQFARGGIPDGMEVCHTCDNPSCVNPDHLFVATHGDNMKDRDQKNRCAHGEAISWSKLTVADVQYIKSSGESVANLACKFDVSFRTIEDVLEERTWRRVA